MKIAILKEDGKLLTFTNIEKFSETWENGRCYIDAQMGSDSEGIVVYEYTQPKSKVITDYFGIPDQPTQERTMKYTAEDFANARFAEDPDGNIAARFGNDPIWPWTHSGGEYKDEAMARFGWAPVPTKPTITESRLRQITQLSRKVWNWTDRRTLQEAGIEIIPDPEPTNTEKLRQLLMVADMDGGSAYRGGYDVLAEYLDSHNVYVKDN